jgi:hypothetical protein
MDDFRKRSGGERDRRAMPGFAQAGDYCLLLCRRGFIAALQAGQLAFEAEVQVALAAGTGLESNHFVPPLTYEQ